jgi:hypothetical protein
MALVNVNIEVFGLDETQAAVDQLLNSAEPLMMSEQNVQILKQQIIQIAQTNIGFTLKMTDENGKDI